MPLDDQLYQDRTLEHFEEPFHRGRCPGATHQHEDDNPLCGDVVRVELAVNPGGLVEEAWFEGDGCCISQAAASMLMERIQGRPISEAKDLTAAQMLELFGAKLTTRRQNCCLLSWRVLQSAIYSPVAAG